MKNKKIIPISLIIPTFNRGIRLIKTIESAMNAFALPSEIIIVDQTISESERIKTQNELKFLSLKFNFNSIYYYYLETQSITCARNYGIKKSRNDFIIFSDDDINYGKDAFYDTFNYLIKEDVSLVCATDSLSRKQNAVRELLSCFCGFKSFKKRKKGSYSNGVFGSYPRKIIGDDVLTEWAMGYYFAIKKSLVEKWGIVFDEKMTKYGYGEDLDFSIRYCEKSKEEGFVCYLSNKIYVEHCVEPSGRESTQTSCSKIFINRFYIYFKFFARRGIKPSLFWWSNLCIIIRSIGKKEFNFYCRANKLCKQYKEQISKGELEDYFYNAK